HFSLAEEQKPAKKRQLRQILRNAVPKNPASSTIAKISTMITGTSVPSHQDRRNTSATMPIDDYSRSPGIGEKTCMPRNKRPWACSVITSRFSNAPP
ncbi:hypothetical protein, partial [Escherichia fergusonii]|uniref:hypothetical protein n=1 Tax=Escherichia fergusonii TaxID=564 RepID=UPI001C5C9159